jgi:hypothetical protein
MPNAPTSLLTACEAVDSSGEIVEVPASFQDEERATSFVVRKPEQQPNGLVILDTKTVKMMQSPCVALSVVLPRWPFAGRLAAPKDAIPPNIASAHALRNYLSSWSAATRLVVSRMPRLSPGGRSCARPI